MSTKKAPESTLAEGAMTEPAKTEAPAPVVEGAEATPEAPAVPEDKGTTESIFGKQEPDGEATPPPAASEETPPVVSPETPPAETKGKQAPPASGIALPRHLSLEENGDDMITTKVDGVEIEKSLKDVLKGYQTDKHLTIKGQAIADAGRELEEKKKTAFETPSPPITVPDPADDYYGDDAAIKAAVKAQTQPLVDKIASLETQVASAAPAVGELNYQHSVKVVDAELKEAGHTDFMKYLPKIEEFVFNLPVEEQAKYSTIEFYKEQYKNLKLLNPIASDELTIPPAEPKPPVDHRPVPPVALIESGGGKPSVPVDQGVSAQLKALRARAIETGSNEDWARYIQVKGL